MSESVAARAERARPLLTGLLGRDPGRLVYQPYGHGNLVFALPELALVAKTSEDPSQFRHTAANVRVLAALGIPVPRVIAQGQADGLAALVLEWIPGRDLGQALASLTPSQKAAIADAVVEIQSRVSALPKGTGYGWTPLGVPGQFPTWLAVVEREWTRLPNAYRTRIELASWRTTLRQTAATPFLDDLTVKNVIVDGGRLRGIVDLDGVCYGDPLFALALAETTAVLDCDDADYGRLLRRVWAPTRRGERLADLYAAIFAAGFLARNPTERMRLFFERRLARAERPNA